MTCNRMILILIASASIILRSVILISFSLLACDFTFYRTIKGALYGVYVVIFLMVFFFSLALLHTAS